MVKVNHLEPFFRGFFIASERDMRALYMIYSIVRAQAVREYNLLCARLFTDSNSYLLNVFLEESMAAQRFEI